MKISKKLEENQKMISKYERFGTELNPSGFPKESLIWIKEQSNDCPNFYSVKTLLNPNSEVTPKFPRSLEVRRNSQ